MFKYRLFPKKELPSSFFLDPNSEECQIASAMAQVVGISKEKAIELGVISNGNQKKPD